MDQEILEKYKQAGKLAAQVLQHGIALVKEDARLIDIAESVDRKILELNAKPAFPINLSLNDMAAHYSPILQDTTIVKATDYVKVDVGIHVDGYIGDTALTIRPAGKTELIICSEKMLETALKLFVPGSKMGEIGEAIENVAKEFGFKPIRNLTGHGLEQYSLHARGTVPNVKTDDKYELQEGEAWAVEPFCTTGSGMVKESNPVMILRYVEEKPSRLPEARRIIDLSYNKYNMLPFAKRWIQKEVKSIKVEMALRQLIAANALHEYEPLREVSGEPVAQSEHTVIVSDKPIITTL